MKLFLPFFYMLSCAAFAQSGQIDLGDSLNAESILKNMDLSNKSIVVLGEDQHFGAVENKLNADLIEVLVKDYGFTDLIIESDFFALHQIAQEKEGNAKVNIFPAWSEVKEFQKVFELNKDSSLNIYGFDSNHHGSYSKKEVINFIENNVSADEKSMMFFKEKASSLLSLWIKDTICAQNKTRFLSIMDTWIKEAAPSSFVQQELMNFKGYALQTWADKTGGVEALVRLRDENMVKNVAYLLKHTLKDRKVIILGAKLHLEPGITKYSKHVDENIGDVLKKREDVVFIFPYVFSGKRGAKDPNVKLKVSKKSKKLLVYELSKESVDYMLIDVKNLDKNRNIYVKNDNASTYGDYLIFIRETYPATRVK